MNAEEKCFFCGEVKIPDTECRGCDECIYGPDGGPAECCAGWGSYCCRCGTYFALGQM